MCEICAEVLQKLMEMYIMKKTWISKFYMRISSSLIPFFHKF